MNDESGRLACERQQEKGHEVAEREYSAPEVRAEQYRAVYALLWRPVRAVRTRPVSLERATENKTEFVLVRKNKRMEERERERAS